MIVWPVPVAVLITSTYVTHDSLCVVCAVSDKGIYDHVSYVIGSTHPDMVHVWPCGSTVPLWVHIESMQSVYGGFEQFKSHA